MWACVNSPNACKLCNKYSDDRNFAHAKNIFSLEVHGSSLDEVNFMYTESCLKNVKY